MHYSSDLIFHVQVVLDGFHALYRLGDFSGPLYLCLGADESAQLHHALVGFHADLQALEALFFQNIGFHLGGDGSVIHNASHFLFLLGRLVVTVFLLSQFAVLVLVGGIEMLLGVKTITARLSLSKVTVIVDVQFMKLLHVRALVELFRNGYCPCAACSRPQQDGDDAGNDVGLGRTMHIVLLQLN
uniref:Uncharacterized protein n=2 Tax=prokaryotic environmental samples TaxID=81490 RepID=B3T3M7_9ZZZZ|nr:hypothetical protein ALOHA_HF4000ANIW133B20ctg3g19 [uncultured marine microorganism HF4000_ANIW133B20]ABZ07610.1 hypothetical protein ALOHA_HF4000ANIW137K11ctg5g1 [uncultured marine microorganism HF4000_ANIW137K11]